MFGSEAWQDLHRSFDTALEGRPARAAAWVSSPPLGPRTIEISCVPQASETGEILVSTTIRYLVTGSGIRFRDAAKTITGRGSDAISLLLVDDGAAGHGALRQPA